MTLRHIFAALLTIVSQCAAASAAFAVAQIEIVIGDSPNEDWTEGPYYGRDNFFADVDGDGRADAIVVSDDLVTVRRSTGSGFSPNEDWTEGPYYGSRGNFFADVDGDGRADAIVVDDDLVTVRRSRG